MAKLTQILVCGVLICMTFVHAWPFHKERNRRFTAFSLKKRGGDDSWEEFHKSCTEILQEVCKHDETLSCDNIDTECIDLEGECKDEGIESDKCGGYHLAMEICEEDDGSVDEECLDGVMECLHNHIPLDQCGAYHLETKLGCKKDKIPDSQCPGYHFGSMYCKNSFKTEHNCPDTDENCKKQCLAGVVECAQNYIPMDQCGEYHINTKAECKKDKIPDSQCAGYHFGRIYCKKSFKTEHNCQDTDENCANQCLTGVLECAQNYIPMDQCGEYLIYTKAGCKKDKIPESQCSGYHFGSIYCKNSFKAEHNCQDTDENCEKQCLAGVVECAQNFIPMDQCGKYHINAKEECKNEKIPESACPGYFFGQMYCRESYRKDHKCKGTPEECTKECLSGVVQCAQNNVPMDQCGDYHKQKKDDKEKDEKDGDEGKEKAKPEEKELRRLLKLREFFNLKAANQ